jgi:glycosyltransferase involved in cell wall biosynthesis
MDGGSTDNTLGIIRKYSNCLSYWVSEPDRGQSHAINKGIARATGRILFWLNSDDICLPNALQRVAEVFCAHPSWMVVVGQARLIDQKDNFIGELRSEFTSWEELATNPRNSIRQVSTFFARELFDELGFLDESLHIAMDTELLVRFTKKYIPLVLNEYLTAYRIHTDAKTSHQLLKGYEESDRTRPQYLITRSMVMKYRVRSSDNWLMLARMEQWSASDRWICLSHAVQNWFLILFTRKFWSAVRKLLMYRKTSVPQHVSR